MVFRFSGKMSKKLHFVPDENFALDPNPYGDWSTHLFRVKGVQYILVTNTVSLYSVVFYGAGLTDVGEFLNFVRECLFDFMVDDGFEFVARRHFMPAFVDVGLSKAYNRSVTGSMNDLIVAAKYALGEGEESPYDVSFRLNKAPMKYLGYDNPKRSFQDLSLG